MNTTEKFEYDIEFFNREKEKQEILNVLRAKPQLINFIYGPINSGKTTLITSLIEELPETYVVFYVNLRRKSITKYEDFIRVLFSVEKNKDIKDIIKGLIAKVEKAIYTSQGIPINDSLLDGFLKKDSREDPLEFLENYFKEISKTKIPILIIDELQMIGDLEINGKLIQRLFNFFIGLTKELHICHVFALSSDSLFIEKVYAEAILKDRCRYLLIDNFDEETTKKFLKKHNFSGKEQENICKDIGGKPAHLIRIIDVQNRGGDVITEIGAMSENRKKEIKDTLRKLRRFGSEVVFDNIHYKIDYNDVLSTLKMFNERDKISAGEIDEVIKMYLVKNNILFAECANETIKPQSKLDLLAIREILKEI